jgi:hypothetical protein
VLPIVMTIGEGYANRGEHDAGDGDQHARAGKLV